MIDGNLTEPNSLSEATERPKIEKSGSFPSILSENLVKTFPVDIQTEESESKEEITECKPKSNSETTAVEPSKATTDPNVESISQQMIVESNGRSLEFSECNKITSDIHKTSELLTESVEQGIDSKSASNETLVQQKSIIFDNKQIETSSQISNNPIDF